jgi:hypothetical protein
MCAAKAPIHSLPAAFRRIRLELAREPGHPAGDSGIGYIIVAPLTAGGHLDVELARSHPEACAVARFRSGADSEHGHLRRRPGGSWSFHYDLLDETEEDDPAYRLDQHRFDVGEYVTVNEDDGAHTYRVIAVEKI